jgi:hypothetical protein
VFFNLPQFVWDKILEVALLLSLLSLPDYQGSESARLNAAPENFSSSHSNATLLKINSHDVQQEGN